MQKAVRTRFVFQPTGHLHIAEARVALLNWLTARHGGGHFLLRINDIGQPADSERIEHSVEDLHWLGLDWDEPLYKQNQHDEPHLACIEQLLQTGHAYYAFDNPEEIQQMRRHARQQGRLFRYPRPTRFPSEHMAKQARQEGRPVVVRFAMVREDLGFDDLILGPVPVHAEEFSDFVIRGTDGRATLRFAGIVDDQGMGITHVIRAQERLFDTPGEIAIQVAAGFDRPIYAHLPLILNPDCSLLRRHPTGRNATEDPHSIPIDLHDFRAAGYLPEVLMTFLSMLGRESPQDPQPTSPNDLIAAFDIRQIERTTASLDRNRLLAMNARAIADAPEEQLLIALRDYLSLNETPTKVADDGTLQRLIRIGSGFATFGHLDVTTRFLFAPDEQIVYDEPAVRKILAKGSPKGLEILADIKRQMATLRDWDAGSIERQIRDFADRSQLGWLKVTQPIQVAIAGIPTSLPVGEILEILGRPRTLSRIDRCLKKLGV